MCPPTYFDIEYSINPWMNINNKVDKELADRQWNNFVSLLRELGDEVECIDAVPGLPDMTFSGDAGVVYNNIFVPSNFRAEPRQNEVGHYIRWFTERDYIIKPVPPEIFFEGLGDVVFHRDRAIIGYGYRSDSRVIQHLQEIIPALQILGTMKICDERYFHLAMALSFIDETTVLYYPPAFDNESVQRLHSIVEHAIAVSDQDANVYFACNNLVIGKTVLLDNCTPILESALAERGYTVRACDMSEFKKSGGSLRCLVLSFLQDSTD
jgi:N-dimethylarginine dimethylaminohydrolase